MLARNTKGQLPTAWHFNNIHMYISFWCDLLLSNLKILLRQEGFEFEDDSLCVCVGGRLASRRLCTYKMFPMCRGAAVEVRVQHSKLFRF